MPWLFSGSAATDATGAITGYNPIFDFSSVNKVAGNIAEGHIFGEEGLIGSPIKWGNTVFGGVDWSNGGLIASAIVAVIPISLATMMEHIGDISAISSTVGKNFIADPGLHRTLMGDGLATAVASLFGSPANTTYGENTGVLALSKVYDPRVVRIAALFAVGISFIPMVSCLIGSIPLCIIGGISFVLYGMIAAIGVRNVVENKVDFTKSRNLIIAAVILVCALGLRRQYGKLFHRRRAADAVSAGGGVPCGYPAERGSSRVGRPGTSALSGRVPLRSVRLWIECILQHLL